MGAGRHPAYPAGDHAPPPKHEPANQFRPAQHDGGCLTFHDYLNRLGHIDNYREHRRYRDRRLTVISKSGKAARHRRVAAFSFALEHGFSIASPTVRGRSRRRGNRDLPSPRAWPALSARVRGGPRTPPIAVQARRTGVNGR